MRTTFAFLIAPLALLAGAVLVLPACTAELEEGCLSGPCAPPGFLADPTTGAAGGGCEGIGGAGGSGGSMCMDTTDVGDFPCEVFTVLKAKCQNCHTDPPQNFAPFPLLTFEDTQAPYGMGQRWQRMADVIASGFMPLGGSLDCDDKKLLLDWLHACAQPAPDGMGCE